MPTKPSRVHPRFLVPDLDPASGEARLPPDESRHLTRVLRLREGVTVSAFDGRGHEFLARVTNTRDTLVTIALIEPVEPAAGPVVPFVLVQSVIKGGGMDEIVRDATMMGATIIQPVVTAHTAVKPAFAKRRENVERWRRIAIASAKQSRRATLPDVREPVGLEAALSAHSADLALMFVEPSAGRDTRSLRTFVGSRRPDRAALIVGPEGGWSEEEIDLGGGERRVSRNTRSAHAPRRVGPHCGHGGVQHALGIDQHRGAPGSVSRREKIGGSPSSPPDTCADYSSLSVKWRECSHAEHRRRPFGFSRGANLARVERRRHVRQLLGANPLTMRTPCGATSLRSVDA